jgi:hypothetical protein
MHKNVSLAKMFVYIGIILKYFGCTIITVINMTVKMFILIVTRKKTRDIGYYICNVICGHVCVLIKW